MTHKHNRRSALVGPSRELVRILSNPRPCTQDIDFIHYYGSIFRLLEALFAPERSIKPANELYHRALLVRRDFRKHRQRQNTSLIAMSVWKLLGTVAKARVCVKERQGRWIVDRRLDPVGVQVRC